MTSGVSGTALWLGTAVTVVIAGCSPAVSPAPTFGPEFAIGGPGLGDRCSNGTAARLAGTSSWCQIGIEQRDMDAPGGPGWSEGRVSVEPGRYWLVLWCDAGTGMEISFRDLPGLTPVTMTCPAGAEPAVVEAGVVESAGKGWLVTVPSGPGTYAGVLVRA